MGLTTNLFIINKSESITNFTDKFFRSLRLDVVPYASLNKFEHVNQALYDDKYGELLAVSKWKDKIVLIDDKSELFARIEALKAYSNTESVEIFNFANSDTVGISWFGLIRNGKEVRNVSFDEGHMDATGERIAAEDEESDPFETLKNYAFDYWDLYNNEDWTIVRMKKMNNGVQHPANR